MKLIKTGNKHKVFGDDLVVLDALSTDYVYTANFNPEEGPYLLAEAVIEVKEEKVYGSRQEKVDKVINTFNNSKRSIGTILSGDKGIGKTLYTVMLSNQLREQGVPTILVNKNFPGVSQFIGSIKQEIMVLFDEFEKTFKVEDGSQDEMLGLFDGLSNDKRLYVITVNEVRELSRFLLNRPGRFHYHIKFKYPTVAETTEYLKDNLQEEYHSTIIDILTASINRQLNYDMLRAIVTEINQGYSVSETLDDLNIDGSSVRAATVVIKAGGVDINLGYVSLAYAEGEDVVDLHNVGGVINKGTESITTGLSVHNVIDEEYYFDEVNGHLVNDYGPMYAELSKKAAEALHADSIVTDKAILSKYATNCWGIFDPGDNVLAMVDKIVVDLDS